MLNPKIWLCLSRDTRLKIAELFNMPKSAIVEVMNNRVVCDGHSAADLLELTIEKMQAFLNSEEDDFDKLFEELVEVIEKPQPAPVEEVVEKPEEIVNVPILDIEEPKVAGPYVDPKAKSIEVKQKPKGRPKKK